MTAIGNGPMLLHKHSYCHTSTHIITPALMLLHQHSCKYTSSHVITSALVLLSSTHVITPTLMSCYYTSTEFKYKIVHQILISRVASLETSAVIIKLLHEKCIWRP